MRKKSHQKVHLAVLVQILSKAPEQLLNWPWVEIVSSTAEFYFQNKSLNVCYMIIFQFRLELKSLLKQPHTTSFLMSKLLALSAIPNIHFY